MDTDRIAWMRTGAERLAFIALALSRIAFCCSVFLIV
jgi:hypothetical protein